MDKKYKHKKLNWIAKESENIPKYYECLSTTDFIPKELIENSEDWELIKEPIYTSQLGEKIYEGDCIYLVTDSNLLCFTSYCKKEDIIPGRTFLHQKTAQDFIDLQPPKILFITEDKIEITNEDTPLYGVCPKGNWQTNLWGCSYKKCNGIHKVLETKSTSWLWFSTKEAAEQYREENEPKYSKKQIKDALENNTITYNFGDYSIYKAVGTINFKKELNLE